MKKITEAKMLAAVKKVATHYRRMSCQGRGVPDALVSYKGQTFFVEVKAPGDKLSKAQKMFMEKFHTLALLAGPGDFLHATCGQDWPDHFLLTCSCFRLEVANGLGLK